MFSPRSKRLTTLESTVLWALRQGTRAQKLKEVALACDLKQKGWDAQVEEALDSLIAAGLVQKLIVPGKNKNGGSRYYPAALYMLTLSGYETKTSDD